MGSSLYLFLVFLLILTYCRNSSSSEQQPLCHSEERSALLHLKQSFSLDESASLDPYAYPKVKSWNLEGEGSDCCSWDGVECNNDTGHVIGLDLSSSFLYGSINSSSSLFSLVHLQRLILSDNHFNFSQIPSKIGRLSRLIGLNISYSVVAGQIPSEIQQLTQLASLDLSYNPLILQKPSLRTLVQNLTKLKELHLSGVNISSSIPHTLANLSALTSLRLGRCGLHGEFPTGIFHLPNLHDLIVPRNPNLTGYLPHFQQSTPLKILWLSDTGFSGVVPDSIGNLISLTQLGLSRCNFSGALPASLSNLTQLTYLSLSTNIFSAGNMPRLGMLTKLTHLLLDDINLYGEIPSSLANLTELTVLFLSDNHLSGQFPSWLTNLTKLTAIQLISCQLRGPIPSSFSKLENLESVDLKFNNLSGTVDEDVFLNLKKLTELQLAGNHISFLTKPKTNASLPQLKYLDLRSCNLKHFPDFLRSQNDLELLLLANNNIQGQIPDWIFNISRETLGTFWLSHNFLTGFNQLPVVLPWVNLGYLDLSHNMLQTLYEKIPNIFTAVDLSSNKLEGEIPESIGNLRGLHLLNLSNNDLIGHIPPSLSNLKSLGSLDLSQNKLLGEIPQQLVFLNFLAFLNVSNNHLSGPIPRGNQFNTFENNSYMGNLALCGDPLSKKCGKPEASVPPPALTIDGEDDYEFPSGIDLICILMGLGSGMVVGFIIGKSLTSRHHQWFVENFGNR